MQGRVLMVLVGVASGWLATPLARGEDPRPQRCVVAELYVSTDSPLGQKAQADLEKRSGLQLRLLNVTTDKNALRRFYSLVDKHKVKAGLPMLHVCKQVSLGYDQPATTGARYDSMLTVEIYVRAGCPHCAAAKAFVNRLEPIYPGLKFVFYDVVAQQSARERYEQVNRAHGIRVPGLPTFAICGEAHVGYSDDATTGAKLQKILEDATVVCEPPAAPKTSSRTTSPQSQSSPLSRLVVRSEQQQSEQQQSEQQRSKQQRSEQSHPMQPVRLVSAGAAIRLPLVTSRWTGMPRWSPVLAVQSSSSNDAAAPGGGSRASPPGVEEAPPRESGEDIAPPPPRPDDMPAESTGDATDAPEDQEQIVVPLFGKLNVKQLGMPLFTILIGLVDGFNPCAMWVLLFLLSILVTMQDRRKILLVAGTFVLISGLAYFAFMAAWLNVFRLIGYRRWSEVVLGLIAVAIGLIHIKDFFAFKKGISLSIPESAKPGIYARVRQIVMAENLTAAVLGAGVLAVLINVVELLCTAGLPALYTKVLTMQGYPTWVEYSYLALYNAAYMADDGLMVAIAVISLGRHKLQEREGRWLKLISGVAIAVLGLILLLAPQWLL